MLMFVGIGFVSVPITVLLYLRINAQRETVMKEAGGGGERGAWRDKYTDKELRELGDRAPDFRYIL